MIAFNESIVTISFDQFVEIFDDFKLNLQQRLGVFSELRCVEKPQFDRGDPRIFLDFPNPALKEFFLAILSNYDLRSLNSVVLHTSYPQKVTLYLRELSGNYLRLTELARETLLTPAGRAILYQDIEQGIKPAIINYIEERIELLRQDNANRYFSFPGGSLRNNVITLLSRTNEVINSLASSRAILTLLSFVDNLLRSYDCRSEFVLNQLITELQDKIDSLLLFYIRNPFLMLLGLAGLSKGEFMKLLGPDAKNILEEKYFSSKEDFSSNFFETAVLSYLTYGEVVYLKEHYGNSKKSTSNEVTFIDSVFGLLKDKGARSVIFTESSAEVRAEASPGGASELTLQEFS